jgi:hypothetical protein
LFQTVHGNRQVKGFITRGHGGTQTAGG